jgi:hypothetical protein
MSLGAFQFLRFCLQETSDADLRRRLGLMPAEAQLRVCAVQRVRVQRTCRSPPLTLFVASPHRATQLAAVHFPFPCHWTGQHTSLSRLLLPGQQRGQCCELDSGCA